MDASSGAAQLLGTTVGRSPPKSYVQPRSSTALLSSGITPSSSKADIFTRDVRTWLVGGRVFREKPNV